MELQTKVWLSEKFGIQQESISWYNSGNCFDRIILFDEDSANKVKDQVKHKFVNGGNYEGMRLGYTTSYVNTNGIKVYDVMC